LEKTAEIVFDHIRKDGPNFIFIETKWSAKEVLKKI
jgi:hypothetical protein